MQNDQIISPFIIGNIIKEPSKFWGRKQECQNIFMRLKKMESSSIVGPRRIGKSSLGYHIYGVGTEQLGDTYELVWLDGQSSHSKSVNNFFKAIAKRSSLNYQPADNLDDCLINFEDAVTEHLKKLIIVINEFEILVDEKHQSEFGKPFFNTLRLLAEQSHCALITMSYTPLPVLCKHVLGISSPFYNIFEQISLKDFTSEEADTFLDYGYGDVTLTASEIQFIRTTVTSYQHPLKLQIACDAIYRNRQNIQSEKELLKQIEARFKFFRTNEEIQAVRSGLLLPPEPEIWQSRGRYASAIVAIENDQGDPIGTGFLVSFQGKPYVITCAHVVKEIGKIEGQGVKTQHFNPSIGELEAEVEWFRVRGNIDAEKWAAGEDICVLKVTSPLPTHAVPFLPEHLLQDYQGKTECWCFGYLQTKFFRGTWIEGISCQSSVGQGFVQLSQSENVKKVGIGKGVSGAPLSDGQGNIIGIIQSIYGKDTAYLIPAKTVYDIILSLVENIKPKEESK